MQEPSPPRPSTQMPPTPQSSMHSSRQSFPNRRGTLFYFKNIELLWGKGAKISKLSVNYQSEQRVEESKAKLSSQTQLPSPPAPSTQEPRPLHDSQTVQLAPKNLWDVSKKKNRIVNEIVSIQEKVKLNWNRIRMKTNENENEIEIENQNGKQKKRKLHTQKHIRCKSH